METKQKQSQKSLKVHVMLKYSHVYKKSWSMVWIRRKDVYVLLGEIQKTLFFSEDDCSRSYFIFTYEQWLVITASWEDLAAVVFVSNRLMSSCVICLVIARESFLLQSDC